MLDAVTPQETEVSAKASRRTFTAKYKRKIVREADACAEPGQVSALLRREGLYSSHLTTWRREVERQELAALEPRKRGPHGNVPDPRDRRIAELERRLASEKHRADRAELLVEIQKKVSSILGLPLPESDERR